MIWHNRIMTQGDFGKFFRYFLHPCFRNFPRRMRAATWGRPYKWEKVHPLCRANRHKICTIFTVIIIFQPHTLPLGIIHIHPRLTGHSTFFHIVDVNCEHLGYSFHRTFNSFSTSLRLMVSIRDTPCSFVVASCASLTLPGRAKLAHSAAPPLPTRPAALGSGGAPHAGAGSVFFIEYSALFPHH